MLLGNGAAMRVAPLGAWFADDLARAAAEAALSATVTHTHPEAVAGAIAVAIAAAVATRGTGDPLAEAVEHTPPSQVRDALTHAKTVSDPLVAAAQLGNGRQTSALDEVDEAPRFAAESADAPLVLDVVVVAGQEGGQAFGGGFEFGVVVDEGAHAVGQPGEGYFFLASAGLEFFDAAVGEVHGGVLGNAAGPPGVKPAAPTDERVLTRMPSRSGNAAPARAPCSTPLTGPTWGGGRRG
ncbi:ADP-ribosylglycohydrolase [Actinokineospora cianjurensis]|uniref:ADP-ribosylglycohydrolase n=1 Tax=Actinokineospora cianjurensis TaxID=585224 RepID=A0A421B9X8_9PSEU|nr:ADP-ribosylglycohydrolase [Actinokineospora cianjurensis]